MFSAREVYFEEGSLSNLPALNEFELFSVENVYFKPRSIVLDTNDLFLYFAYLSNVEIENDSFSLSGNNKHLYFKKIHNLTIGSNAIKADIQSVYLKHVYNFTLAPYSFNSSKIQTFWIYKSTSYSGHDFTPASIEYFIIGYTNIKNIKVKSKDKHIFACKIDHVESVTDGGYNDEISIVKSTIGEFETNNHTRMKIYFNLNTIDTVRANGELHWIDIKNSVIKKWDIRADPVYQPYISKYIGIFDTVTDEISEESFQIGSEEITVTLFNITIGKLYKSGFENLVKNNSVRLHDIYIENPYNGSLALNEDEIDNLSVYNLTLNVNCECDTMDRFEIPSKIVYEVKCRNRELNEKVFTLYNYLRQYCNSTIAPRPTTKRPNRKTYFRAVAIN